MEIPTIVKWAGGKKQLLEQFKPLYPKTFKNYYEPFVGSGAVFFYLRQIELHRKAMYSEPERTYHLSDNNEDLVNVYLDVRDNVDKISKLLEEHKQKHSEDGEYYYQVRDKFNGGSKGIKRSAQFIYLNKTCFNGLYRVNSKGEFNVPKGDYTKPPILNGPILKEASRLLQGVDIKCMSFEKTESLPQKGDFVYLDPPYYPLSKTSNFTSYTKEDFTEKDQERLAEYFKKLDKRGCYLMLSNSNMDFIKGLYKDYKIKKVKAKRAISCNGEGRGEIDEIVATNY